MTTLWLQKAQNKSFYVLLLLHLLSSFINKCYCFHLLLDYACTADDWSVIANIRNEVSDKRQLVSIEDAYLKKSELLLLLTPGEFVGDEVSIYI